MTEKTELSSLLYDNWKDIAGRMPDTLAVQDESGSWSYGELLNASDRVRNSLPGPEEMGKASRLAAVFGDKDKDYIAAVLGSLDAGFGYVGIAPWGDADLLQRNFDACGLEVLVTTALFDDQKEVLDQLERKPKFILDIGGTLDPGDERYAGTTFLEVNKKDKGLNWRTSPEEIAYVLFTSGSTGQSKAVCVSHRAATSAVKMFQRDVPVKEGDVIGQEVPGCFDLFMLDLSALERGAALNLFPHVSFQEGKLLEYIVNNKHVTSMFTVPSIIDHERNTAADPKELAKLASLKRILFSGEPISDALARALAKFCPDTEVLNLYGGTEFPYFLAQEVRSPEKANSFDLEVNAKNVLDVPFKIVPREGLEEGQGELCVSGDVLFSGYLSHGKISPYQRVDKKYYPTGDVASVINGELTLHGRLDDQVKVQGIRVKLRDIERRLECIPEIIEAAAVLNPNNEIVDIFYVLKDECQNFMPSLPGATYDCSFNELPSLPRTPSGKKDRKELRCYNHEM